MKRWKKPVVVTITSKDLSEHIRASAWSGGCVLGHFNLICRK